MTKASNPEGNGRLSLRRKLHTFLPFALTLAVASTPLAAEASWWGGSASLGFLLAALFVAAVYAGVTYVGTSIGIIWALRRGPTPGPLWAKVAGLTLTGLNALALLLALIGLAFLDEVKVGVSPLMLLPSVAGVALPLAWTVLLFRKAA